MPFLPELKEIKYIRRKLNLTQKDLEKALKIPQSTLSRIEKSIHGKSKKGPSYMTVKRIFEFLENEKLKMEKLEKKAKHVMTQDIISITIKGSTIKDAVNLMNDNSLSQIPIIEDNQNLGSITAKKIQKVITDNPDMINAEIDLIRELPFPEIEKNWDIKDISNLLTSYPAVLVKEFGEFIGIVTDADLLQII